MESRKNKPAAFYKMKETNKYTHTHTDNHVIRTPHPGARVPLAWPQIPHPTKDLEHPHLPPPSPHPQHSEGHVRRHGTHKLRRNIGIERFEFEDANTGIAVEKQHRKHREARQEEHAAHGVDNAVSRLRSGPYHLILIYQFNLKPLTRYVPVPPLKLSPL